MVDRLSFGKSDFNQNDYQSWSCSISSAFKNIILARGREQIKRQQICEDNSGAL